MNSQLDVLLALVIILTFTAIKTKKSWLRYTTTIILFLLLAGTAKFSVESSAREAVTQAAQNGAYTKEFGNGVKAFMTALAPARIFMVMCGAGLFLISLIRSRKDKNNI